jgi:hypothetical protein
VLLGGPFCSLADFEGWSVLVVFRPQTEEGYFTTLYLRLPHQRQPRFVWVLSISPPLFLLYSLSLFWRMFGAYKSVATLDLETLEKISEVLLKNIFLYSCNTQTPNILNNS